MLNNQEEESWIEIGPFFDRFDTFWYSVPLAPDAYEGNDFRLLLQSPMGEMFRRYWGAVMGGDTATC